jgi:hypothetical protein
MDDTPDLPPDIPSVIGLLPIPINRSYGLTLHLPITNQDYLLTHPDIPMFRNVEHAVSRFSRSTHAPLGTTRVFSSLPFTGSQAIHTIRNTFIEFMKTTLAADATSLHGKTLGRFVSGHYSWNRNSHNWEGPQLEDCITIVDTPIVTSPDLFDPSTLRTFQTLTVLSQSIHQQLLDRFATVENAGVGIFGFPALRLTPLRKDGTPRRRPGAAISAKREAALLARGSAITQTLCKDLVSTLDRLASPIIKPGHYNDGFSFHPSLYMNANTSYRERRKKGSKKTLDDQAEFLADYISNLNTSLAQLFRWKSSPSHTQRGSLRSPLVFLRKHRRQAVLDALLPFDAHLDTMLNYPTNGISNKITPWSDQQRGNIYRELRKNLLKLKHAMLTGHFCALSSAHSVSAADRRRPVPLTPVTRESTPLLPSQEEMQELCSHV